ncbi:adhesion G protein-coupled receptor E1 isoform X22 [Carassius gibelio]|uniref:adhesion G protein-coupled receptor E1 isoform X16 n=1 Tax=Carassius gibelio TaxID=101364 RepID=UPI002279C4BE|nr:adhesion G protein-coupled receptor E1 isoform X16 [Carassius gibelio]XP_052463632.1 adhesion G protein-coupled receptor E1 isoform X17 [Carassius gibelio]XP_052463634.1 adhesion G protein-coupled receptor E1 isoform X18 [Carassius gibelio]XP_052463635.1 adhesion G protein-coupled receptor E1 isoform X19 [Carassius gibelio]XP_052463636.1 adhesion G protein-coupled receptor E1 isoform X20 [Carassius gibelio]XP_052463637.1 adhesion G protein-coupled receptor E1 isoform X21 [Carassius gibelio]
MSDECHLCLLGLIFLSSLLTGIRGVDDVHVFISSGEDVRLSCNNALHDCTSTTWNYNSHSAAVELICLGKKRKDTERHERLSLGSDCSLNIRDISTEDSGAYTCQQWTGEGGQRIRPDARVHLHVLQVSHTEISAGLSVTLFCQLYSYDRVSCDDSARSERIQLFWVNQAGVKLTRSDGRYQISSSSDPCIISLNTTLLNEDDSREWRCEATQRDQVKTSVTYTVKSSAVTNIISTDTTVTPETTTAAVTNIISTDTTVTPETTTAVINITLQEGCTTSGGCLKNLFEKIENITATVLPLNLVTNILTMAFNASEKILETTTSASPTELASYGNSMLKTSEKLISTLVKPTDTNDSVKFNLPTVEGQVFMVGPQVTLDKIPRLDTTNSSVDIDLIGIAKNNYETRSAAVAFMSYNTMENLLKPDFFNTSNKTVKTMMSTVISATLPKTSNTKLTEPVNFMLKHIRKFDPIGSLSCVYWNISEWIVDGCVVLKTNGSYTVCSCDHLSTFALIMQTSQPPASDPLLELLNLVCVFVGLVFFSLALLTFALCQWSPGVNNVARINICISLLLAHLLLLLTQQFLSIIQRQKVLCAVISGLLHFLFLSGFVWMFIEAVLLFICVKNLSQISFKKSEVLSSGFLCVIGYVVALVVVCVSVGLVPEGYGSEHCWLKMDKNFIWSFLGPVCVILALNMILFIKILITLNSVLKNLNAEVSQMKQTKILVFKTLAQFVVLGCSWILGFFTNDSKVLEILFLILNSQQGTFIFLIYGVLNNKVMQQYRKFFRRLCCIRQY